jgi:MerR family mercuric resistance operon transcriptional regulator
MTRQNTSPRSEHVTIGVLSRRTGVNIETIRYYERIGLLPAPLRSEGRHRLYDRDRWQQLSFVRRSRELGFSIEEIRALLGLAEQGDRSCGEVRAITEGHLADIRGKIADLQKLERVLSKLARACKANRMTACPVLEALSRPA